MKFRISFDPAVWNRRNILKACCGLTITAIVGVSFISRAAVSSGTPERFGESLKALGLYNEGDLSGSYSVRNSETKEYCDPSEDYQFTLEGDQRYELYIDLLYTGVSETDSIACAKIALDLPQTLEANQLSYLTQKSSFSSLAEETEKEKVYRVPLICDNGKIRLNLLEDETRIIGQRIFYPGEDFSMKDLLSSGAMISNGDALNGIINYNGNAELSLKDLLEARIASPELTLGEIKSVPTDGISVVRIKLVFDTEVIKDNHPKLGLILAIGVVGISVLLLVGTIASTLNNKSRDELDE